MAVMPPDKFASEIMAIRKENAPDGTYRMAQFATEEYDECYLALKNFQTAHASSVQNEAELQRMLNNSQAEILRLSESLAGHICGYCMKHDYRECPHVQKIAPDVIFNTADPNIAEIITVVGQLAKANERIKELATLNQAQHRIIQKKERELEAKTDPPPIISVQEGTLVYPHQCPKCRGPVETSFGQWHCASKIIYKSENTDGEDTTCVFALQWYPAFEVKYQPFPEWVWTLRDFLNNHVCGELENGQYPQFVKKALITANEIIR